MPLRDELRRACLNGPEALQALIRAKGLQLGAELNVLREVLRAIVLDGAQPGVLAVLAKQLKWLSVKQSNGDTINAITELIVIEQESDLVYTSGPGTYVRRDPDNTFRRSIAAAVQEALKHMRTFNLEEQIPFRGGRGYISSIALANTAFYVYEALRLPLGNLVAKIFIPHGHHMSRTMALEAFKNVADYSPFEELEMVYAELSQEVDTHDEKYNEVIVGLKVDLQKRIQSEIQLAAFLGIYRPIFSKTRTGRRILAMNAFPAELFHLIMHMVLGEC